MILRVYYEDTDAGGVVYHSKYLNFCERARSELFFRAYPHIFDAQSGHFLLAKANCTFLKPAQLGDTLEVKSTLLELKNASVIVKQEIFRGGERLFSGDFTLAFIKNEKPVAMSGELKAVFGRIFKQEGGKVC